MAITFKSNGDFSKTKKFLEKIKQSVHAGDLNKFGRMGVDALEKATPRETGKTAKSWSYKILHEKGVYRIEWHNDNMDGGVPIVVLLQYGHATNSGYYVRPNDFINPAMEPVFEKIAEMAWGEVTKA